MLSSEMSRASSYTLLFLLLCLGMAGAEPLDEAALHYLRRTRLAFTSGDVKSVGQRDLLSQLSLDLRPSGEESALLQESLALLPYHHLEPREIYLALLDEPEATTVIEEEMVRSRVVRGVLSDHQLREVMTDFWFNHFNADPDKGEVVACNIARLEQGLRKHAFGRFEEILSLAVRNPAVLENLDNTVSDGRAVNENFGRELMELYTTGPFHTQQDVVEVARCFSGWSYENDPDSPEFLSFRYYPELHSKGVKTVFDKSYGDHQQDELLRDLARHPATARYICQKLVTRFVGDQPPQALVERAAQEFLASGGEVSQVLEVILSSPEFFASEQGKLRTPIEFVVAAMAHSGYDRTRLLEFSAGKGEARAILDAVAAMGSPYSCPNPLGWPDRSKVWESTRGQRHRQKVARLLASNAHLSSVAEVIDVHLFGRASGQTRTALRALEGQVQELHIAALMSPEFQSR